MTTWQQTLQLVSRIGIFLAIIPGFWIAGWFMPYVLRALKPEGEEAVSEPRALPVLIWFALAGVFAAPWIDLILIFQSVSSIVQAYTLQINLGQPNISWGSVSWGIYSISTVSLTVLIYAYTFWIGRKALNQGSLPGIRRIELTSLERSILLLTFAGLVDSAIRLIAINFLSLRLPFLQRMELGIFGFVAGFLLALLILALVAFYLDNKIIDMEEEAEEGDVYGREEGEAAEEYEVEDEEESSNIL